MSTQASLGSASVDPRPKLQPFVANRQWRGALVVLAATVVMAMGFGGLGMAAVFMRPMESDLSWSRSFTSFGYACSAAGMALGGLLWGRISDRADMRLLLGIGGAGMVGSTMAMASVQSVVAFCLANLAYGGLGFSVIYFLLISASAEWYPQRRGLVTGIVTAGGAMGQGLLPCLASLLIGAWGWRSTFVGVGGAFMLAFALAFPVLRWPQGPRTPTAAPESRAPSRDAAATVRLLALAALLCCLCMGIPVLHLASFVALVCGSRDVGVHSLVIAMSFGALGRVCFGLIADRTGALPAYAAASCTQTACVVLYPALEGGASLMALSAIFGFGFAGNMTCLALCVRSAVDVDRFGAALSFVMALAWVGMALGGYIGGALFDLTSSYAPSFLLAAGAGALNLATIGVALRRHGRRHAASSLSPRLGRATLGPAIRRARPRTRV